MTFHSVGNVIIPTDSYIFQRGRYTTKQFMGFNHEILDLCWKFLVFFALHGLRLVDADFLVGRISWDEVDEPANGAGTYRCRESYPLANKQFAIKNGHLYSYRQTLRTSQNSATIVYLPMKNGDFL